MKGIQMLLKEGLMEPKKGCVLFQIHRIKTQTTLFKSFAILVHVLYSFWFENQKVMCFVLFCLVVVLISYFICTW